MISWLSLDVIDPPANEEIILQNPENKKVKLATYNSNESSLEWFIEWQMSEGFTKWSDTE